MLRTVSWEEFGRMLMTYEGWKFSTNPKKIAEAILIIAQLIGGGDAP